MTEYSGKIKIKAGIHSFLLLLLLITLCAAQQSWISRSSGTVADLFGLTWGDGNFVAVGAGGTILTSENGADWTTRVSGTKEMLKSVTWGAGQFMAVGTGGTVVTSDDGVQWVTRPIGVTYPPGSIYEDSIPDFVSVVYGNGLFVIAGSNGLMLFSEDGVDWKVKSVVVDIPWSRYYDAKQVIFMDDQFMAVGGPLRYTSSDGIEWTLGSMYVNSVTSPVPLNLLSVAFGKGVYVIVDQEFMLKSDNADECLIQNSGDKATAVVYGHDIFVAVGNDLIQTSPDGYEWAKVSSANSVNNAVVYGDSIFVVAGSDGAIQSSAAVASSVLSSSKPVKGSGVRLKSNGCLLQVNVPSLHVGQKMDFAIYTTSGRRVLSIKQVNCNDGNVMIPVSRHAPGTYIFSGNSPAGRFSAQIFIGK